MTASAHIIRDKTDLSVVSLAEADDELSFWLSKAPEERLQAVELNRQALYGYNDTPSGILRVLEIATREPR